MMHSWHRTLPVSRRVSQSRTARVLLAMLIAVAMGHGALHHHESPSQQNAAVSCDSHEATHHVPNDHGDAPDNNHANAPCQTCILIAGLELPTVALVLSPPTLPTAPLAIGDELSPPSHVSWSRLLLRGPPHAC